MALFIYPISLILNRFPGLLASLKTLLLTPYKISSNFSRKIIKYKCPDNKTS